MAIHSGFFNALSTGGTYDRVYDADDYCDNMGAIISNGVRRSGDNDLKVSATGMVLKVGIGRAWIQGHWLNNDTEYTVATVIAPTGTSRKDGVFVRLDTNTSVRSMSIVYRTGTASVYPACVRSGGIYELMLAKIDVAAGATNLTVTDTRASKSLCGWVRSPVGYDDYFDSLDSAFEDWFDAMKGQLSEDAAGNLQNQISQQNAVISKYVPVELYAWDEAHDEQQMSYCPLSESCLNYDKLIFEVAEIETVYDSQTEHQVFYRVFSENNKIYSFDVPDAESWAERSSGVILYFDCIDLQGVIQDGEIITVVAGYGIPIDHPDRVVRLGRDPDVAPTGADTDKDIRIMKVLGYGNRNAPPIAPYQEVQSDTVTDEVEEVVTP